MQISPYLSFDGNCEEAFRFYEELLRGKIVMMMTNGESPVAEHVPAKFHNRIMHARMYIGDEVLMGSDCPEDNCSKPAGFCVSIVVDTPEEADRIFEKLADGGNVQMPIEETFWAVRFGMATDRFGTPWMVNCEKAM